MSEQSAEQGDRLSDLADGWDAGYAAAVTVFEAGLFRLAAQGVRGLDGMARPNNPYRIGDQR